MAIKFLILLSLIAFFVFCKEVLVQDKFKLFGDVHGILIGWIGYILGFLSLWGIIFTIGLMFYP